MHIVPIFVCYSALVALTIAATPRNRGVKNLIVSTVIRESGPYVLCENRNTCSLYIKTDPMLWQHVMETIPDHQDPRKLDEVQQRTRQKIVNIIANHISALNYIFRDAKFDGAYEHRNIQFEVQRIKIETTYDCMSHISDRSRYCDNVLTAPGLLDMFSSEDHTDFCLAYLFTYRNFQDGVLGLSREASPDQFLQRGGICEMYKMSRNTDSKDGEGPNFNKTMSFNTGIITLAGNGSLLPDKVSQINLSRHVGRSFGASDDKAECQTGDEKAGNFIMYGEALTGDKPYNSQFSTCSIQAISAVLDAMVTGRRRNCFTIKSSSFCGNQIVEEGEECDCGIDDNECHDRCCYPRLISAYDRYRNSTAKPCARRGNTQEYTSLSASTATGGSNSCQ